MANDLSLRPHPKLAGRPGPLLVVVMDGVGEGRCDGGDAVHLARTPTLDRLRASAFWRSIAAHGTAVGLPSDADMGNSEVGHNCLGAGRVFDQGAKLVNQAIESGALFRGETWQAIARRAVEGGGALHLIGLLSDGNVHSHIDHLVALIRQAAKEGVRHLYVHALLDGRDVPETSALTYVDQLERVLAELDGSDGRRYRIASGGGRMQVTMDRYEADWSIVERGWRAHVRGDARGFATAREAVETMRREEPGIIDQDLGPFVIVEGDGPVGPIRDGDSVVLFNFRGDRAIELSRAFEEESLDRFDRGPRPDVLFAGMMEYDGDLHVPKRYLVQPPAIDRTMSQLLVHAKVTQFACSETQKFGHVTYFWNGNRSGYIDEALERYVEVPSDRVPFEQRPWMKAAEIADETIAALKGGDFRFLRINFANGDMVGHTGSLDSTVIAMEALDLSLGRILKVIDRIGGVAIVTADHGNADDMFERAKDGSPLLNDETGRPRAKTSHTLSPVPFAIHDAGYGGDYAFDPGVRAPGLANVAATCLTLLGFEPPEDFAPSLVTAR